MTNRNDLAPLLGQCLRWRGTLARRGNKAKSRRTGVRIALLNNVRPADSNAPHVDHVWVSGGRWFEGIPNGSEIYFDATVAQYKRFRADPLRNAEPGELYELIEPRNVVVARRGH